jgi:hypothetical protein
LTPVRLSSYLPSVPLSSSLRLRLSVPPGVILDDLMNVVVGLKYYEFALCKVVSYATEVSELASLRVIALFEK